MSLQAGNHRAAGLRLDGTDFTSDGQGIRSKKKTLPVQAKVSLATAWPGGHGLLPAEPRTGKRPELTTAPLRPAPLKLLPFGGAARCRASELIKTQDKSHHNRPEIREIRMTARAGIAAFTALLMGSIAFFHFTWPAQASIIRLRVVAGRAAGTMAVMAESCRSFGPGE